ncbi:unnamed protein product [Ceratitis capitata]|uniref:(Mediterranean fruit fly) hypothetical protein n=1 Tax=Ceratitis capitata TaxID=7213 RepID=A0A811VK92_CERCA|nr:unnamed protein product [Ceratitis capitata]
MERTSQNGGEAKPKLTSTSNKQNEWKVCNTTLQYENNDSEICELKRFRGGDEFSKRWQTLGKIKWPTDDFWIETFSLKNEKVDQDLLSLRGENFFSLYIRITEIANVA